MGKIYFRKAISKVKGSERKIKHVHTQLYINLLYHIYKFFLNMKLNTRNLKKILLFIKNQFANVFTNTFLTAEANSYQLDICIFTTFVFYMLHCFSRIYKLFVFYEYECFDYKQHHYYVNLFTDIYTEIIYIQREKKRLL